MKTRILYAWDYLRESYWFVPAVMTITSMVMAFVSLSLDRMWERESRQVQYLSWGFGGGPEGAREVLSTVAGSMITVAGVVFSITIVALTLASSQFGPRLLRNFIRDRRNQVVLGTFVSTFVYCLLILRAIRGPEGRSFVPELSVTIGVALALLSLGVLIYFIHHIAISIQATQVINRVSDELTRGIPNMFPHQIGEPVEGADVEEPAGFDSACRAMRGEGSGYLAGIQHETLMELTTSADVIVRFEVRPGDFIVAGNVLAQVWPAEKVDDEFDKEFNQTLVLGSQRTHLQDLEFSINQLVEIAVRALSTGINDPMTASQCIDRLGEAFCEIGKREWPSPHRIAEDGKLRIIAKPYSYTELLRAAFGPIREYGNGSSVVLGRLIDTLGTIYGHTSRKADREALKVHAGEVMSAASRTLSEEDMRDVRERFNRWNESG